jgi:hypothetical protein
LSDGDAMPAARKCLTASHRQLSLLLLPLIMSDRAWLIDERTNSSSDSHLGLFVLSHFVCESPLRRSHSTSISFLVAIRHPHYCSTPLTLRPIRALMIPAPILFPLTYGSFLISRCHDNDQSFEWLVFLIRDGGSRYFRTICCQSIQNVRDWPSGMSMMMAKFGFSAPVGTNGTIPGYQRRNSQKIYQPKWFFVQSLNMTIWAYRRILTNVFKLPWQTASSANFARFPVGDRSECSAEEHISSSSHDPYKTPLLFTVPSLWNLIYECRSDSRLSPPTIHSTPRWHELDDNRSRGWWYMTAYHRWTMEGHIIFDLILGIFAQTRDSNQASDRWSIRGWLSDFNIWRQTVSLIELQFTRSASKEVFHWYMYEPSIRRHADSSWDIKDISSCSISWLSRLSSWNQGDLTPARWRMQRSMLNGHQQNSRMATRIWKQFGGLIFDSGLSRISVVSKEIVEGNLFRETVGS